MVIKKTFLDKIRKSVFFKDSLAYSGTNVIAQLLTVIRSFAVRRILPPEIMGFWNFMTVVQGFLGTFDLGVIAGATRELPLIGARGDNTEKKRIYSTTLWFTVIQNCIVALFAVWYVRWHHSQYSTTEITVAFAGIAVFLISSFYTVYSTFFITSQAFVLLSRILIAFAVIDCIGFVVFAWFWSLPGLIIISIVSVILRGAVFIFLGRLINLQTKVKISLRSLKRLLSFGFFLRIVDYPNALFNMVSILWVTKFTNVEALALFSLARGFSMQVNDISTRVGSVYTMRFLEQVGSGISREVIGRQMKQYLLFQLMVIIPALCWVAFIGLTFIVNSFIPKYAGANESFLILIISSFFYVLNSGLTNPWMAEKKLLNRGMANVFGLLAMVGAIAVTWFIFKGTTIRDVAYASVAGSYLYFVYMVIAVGKSYWSMKERIGVVFSVTAAALWTFGVLYAGFIFMDKDAQGFIANFEAMFPTAFLSLIAMFLLVLYGVKKSRIMGGWLK
ncbi:MAG: hypothetical protein ABIJ37_02510 [Pseudomonadota bacterium]